MGLIFTEFATSLKSLKKDTAKKKRYYTSLLRVIEIAKIGLSENLTHLPCVVFAKISRHEKFPIYGTKYYVGLDQISMGASKELIQSISIVMAGTFEL